MQPLEDQGGTTAGAPKAPDDEDATCAVCGEPADQLAYFAKSY